MERKEVLLFNQDAYREAVINAFVHNHWLDGPPAFTVFQDRIEILSKGLLPPKQTLDGFFAGESIPVNEKLAKIILQLHISEQTGRGVPAIVNAYDKSIFRFSENNIKVTIPFDRLENENYTQDQSKNTQDKAKNTQNQVKNTQDKAKNTQDNTPVSDENAPLDAPVKGENAQVNGKNAQVKVENAQVDTLVKSENTPVKSENTPVKSENTPVKSENTPVKIKKGTEEIHIIDFCSEPKGILEIAVYLGYKEKKSVRKFLKPLLEQGRIAMTMPEKPNSRFQKYITIK